MNYSEKSADSVNSGSHYNEEYFKWQKQMGEFGGIENLYLFQPHIENEDKVIDFGCGGGYLLAKLNCREKIGVEINSYARENAEKLGVRTVESCDRIEDNWADVIISNNVLEHTFCPYTELKKLSGKLRKGGKAVFVVPHELRGNYDPEDINKHLYTWSPLCIGNLFSAAGFRVVKVEKIRYLWPPKAFALRKILGKQLFDLVCRIYCVVFGSWYQVKVIAEK